MSVYAEALPSPFPEGPHFSALAGLCLLLTLLLGQTLTTTYDEFRRPQSIAATGSQSWQNLTVATSYDNRGNPLTITRTGGDQPGTEISRVVDGYGQITSESEDIPNRSRGCANKR